MYKHFKHIEEDLQAENMLKAKSRQPRAPLDIVGNIASSLFGVLDSTYADKMVQAITKVKANEKHLLTLLRNQTSLIDSTINVIKRDEISSCKRLKKIENYIAESTGTECRFIKLSRYITLATQLSLLASSLPRMQTEIINVLAHIRRNTISPMFVSPRQLKDQLDQIQNYLKPGQRHPVSPDNILMAYKMMRTEETIIKEHFIIKVNLPLVSTQILDIYRLTPIPFLAGDEISMFAIKTPYIAINSHRNKFVEMSETDLKACQERSKDDYNKQEMLSSETICEMQMFHNKTVFPCKLIKAERPLVWLGTQAKNHWIFTTRSTLTLSAVCLDGTSNINLRGSGLMVAKPGCTIRNTLMTITSQDILETTLSTSYARFGEGELTENLRHNSTRSTSTSLMEDPNLRYKELYQRDAQLLPSNSFKLSHNLET